MELEHRFSELSNGVRQRGVRPLERWMTDRFAGLFELVACGEQVLDRLVVERLRERLPLALLGFEGVGEQPRPALGEARDLRRAAVEQERKPDARGSDPGQEAGLGRDETRRLRLVGGRVEHGLGDVRRHGHDDGDGRDRRPEAEGDGDGDEEEREPIVRERAAGENREHADRRDVDTGCGQGEAFGRGPQVHPREQRRRSTPSRRRA